MVSGDNATNRWAEAGIVLAPEELYSLSGSDTNNRVIQS